MRRRITPSRSGIVRYAALLSVIIVVCASGPVHSREAALPAALDAYLTAVFPKSGVPGMAVAVVKDGQVVTRALGQASDGVAVTDATAFELGSCSKSFTALAALQLVADGRLAMADSVGKYLPGFHVRLGDRDVDVTVEQLLHHTSGLPWRTIGAIAASDDDGALRRTAMAFSGFQVEARPGTQFIYTSANYDVLGAVIEAASGMEFGAYLEDHIFLPLGLTNTHVLKAARADGVATGHKRSFFAPRPYTAPFYRGNAPAAYVVSTAHDMGRWLSIQLGLVATPLAPLIELSHVADREVPPDPSDGGSYAAGWSVYPKPKGEIGHSGANPSFTAYVGFSPGGGFGVAVLADSNSPETPQLGKNLMALLRGDEPPPLPRPDSAFDRGSSVVAACIAALLLGALGMLGRIVGQTRSKRRRFRRPTRRALAVGAAAAIALIPLIGGAVMLPRAVAGIPLDVAVVWLPGSFPVALFAFVALVLLGYAVSIASALFPIEREGSARGSSSSRSG